MFRTCAAALCLLACASASWAQVRAGDETRVNTFTPGTQLFGSVATSPNGGLVVVWSDQSGRDGDATSIFGQRYDRAGGRLGSEFQVNTSTTGYQSYNGLIGLASDRNGRFVVAWGAAPYLENWDVFARRFDEHGAPVGVEFRVNTSTEGSNGGNIYGSAVALAMAPKGDFIVAWASYDVASSSVKGQRFDSQGNRQGGEFVINTATGQNLAPQVAMNASGDFVVAWAVYEGIGQSDVQARRFTATGAPSGEQFQVNTYTTGVQGYLGLVAPKVTLADSGSFMVLWNSSRQEEDPSLGVRAQAYDQNGARVGSEFRVNTYTTDSQSFFHASADALGNVTVAWQGNLQDGDSRGIFAQRLTAAGAPRGEEFRVNTFTTGFEGVPNVGSDREGNFNIVWHGPNEGSTGILLQRYGGLLATALDVDTSRNHVLEPGETADVKPAWRNVNGAAQTFSAALSGATGPQNGVPILVDQTGDYGMVANGALASCVDCYTVSIPDPAPRPALHWDGTVVESISPDGHGQQKVWPLHVGRSFRDVAPENPFYPFVEVLLHNGVTGGCTATDYCPTASTTRGQMAAFALVAKEGAGYAPPACTTPVFSDVPASDAFCRFVEELARRGVVSGCGGGRYCPDQPVSREQMAVFTLRTLDPALDPPVCTTPAFTDVPAGSPFCRWIEELARRHVVSGCGGGRYCPADPVTREQMGVFISATFALTLYGS